jgi:hypothetical protein
MKNYKKLLRDLKLQDYIDPDTGEKKTRKSNLVKFADKLSLNKSENNFNSELSLSEKQKISKYHKILFGEKNNGALNQDAYIYRPRNKNHKKLALEASGITENAPELKAVPIPRANPKEKISFEFKKDKIISKEGNVSRETILFNRRALAGNPRREITRVWNKLKNKKSVKILSGKREIIGTKNDRNEISALEGMIQKIEALQQTYSNSAEWLIGLSGYSFNNQKTFKEYKTARAKGKNAKKKNRNR